MWRLTEVNNPSSQCHFYITCLETSPLPLPLILSCDVFRESNQLYICLIPFCELKVEKPAPSGMDVLLLLLFLVCCVRSRRVSLFTEAYCMWGVVSRWRGKVVLVLHCITYLKIKTEDHRTGSCTKTSQYVLLFTKRLDKRATWPKVIFLSFTFLCLLLSLHALMYLVLPLPPHSLLLLIFSSTSRLSAGLARQTFRYSCLHSPSLTSDNTLHTLHCAGCCSLISWLQVLLSVMWHVITVKVIPSPLPPVTWNKISFSVAVYELSLCPCHLLDFRTLKRKIGNVFKLRQR